MKIFYVKMKKINQINKAKLYQSISEMKYEVIHLPSKSTQASESYSMSMNVPFKKNCSVRI